MPASKQPLTTEQLDRALGKLPSWSLKAGKLHRELKFPDFVDAFGFMAKVAILAESLNHHPDWSNVYNSVTIDLSTHEVGGVSELDVHLATRIEGLAKREPS